MTPLIYNISKFIDFSIVFFPFSVGYSIRISSLQIPRIICGRISMSINVLGITYGDILGFRILEMMEIII